MSLIYDNQTVSYLQNLLNQGQVSISSVESYDTLLPSNQFRMGEISLTFIKEQNKPKIPGYSTCSYMGENATKEYMKEWKKLPISTHLIKDMRKLVMDNDGHVPYKEFVYNDQFNNKKRALVRHLFEIENMDADQPECVEYYETYTDLIHLDQCYMIVKIVDANDAGYNQKTDLKLDTCTIITPYDYSPSITPIPEADNTPVEEPIDNALF